MACGHVLVLDGTRNGQRPTLVCAGVPRWLRIRSEVHTSQTPRVEIFTHVFHVPLTAIVKIIGVAHNPDRVYDHVDIWHFGAP